jgi:hypothetical protein
MAARASDLRPGAFVGLGEHVILNSDLYHLSAYFMVFEPLCIATNSPRFPAEALSTQ